MRVGDKVRDRVRVCVPRTLAADGLPPLAEDAHLVRVRVRVRVRVW